jgi:hypothetical protein
MKKANALATALHKSGATVAARASEAPLLTAPAARVPLLQQSSRQGTKAITVHFPEPVRRQLKTMAAEQGRDMEDLVGEALNLVFAKYRKPELAPRKPLPQVST